MNAPTRPVLRWHGGKWRLAPWILAHLPPHRIYVEPFGGAASVLLQKPRAYAEVYNDLDSEVVNLFRVLRDEGGAARLVEALGLTPFARAEFVAAYFPSPDPVERARQLCIRSFMGVGAVSNAVGSKATGFRNNATRDGTIPAHDWAGYPAALRKAIERLRGVIVEDRPASEVMAAYDGHDTLHYVDPPYLAETRSKRAKRAGGVVSYAVELTDDEHADLLAFLRGLTGMVVLSGYPSALYDDALVGWRRVTTDACADGARSRIEVLWINPAAADALDRSQTPLLAGGTA